MPQLQSEAPNLHLERARDHVGGSRTAWCADYWRWGVPGPEVVVEGITEAKKAYKAALNRQKLQKTGGFTHVLAYKSPKTPFLLKST